IPALAFAGAPRYHNGGVLGLAPDEVPIIGRRGEEVLTVNDPRHRANGGGGHAVNVVMNISTPDAASFGRSQGQIAAQARVAIERATRDT
ncbi:MAG: phage tail tape measure protein, partial [Gammaproteobacteria bacterium]